VRAERTTGVVRFSVIDEGPGVAPEDRPRLFERYFQATRMLRSGSGLGLFIAKGIADAHAGQIGVETEPGAGSSFWVTLPLA
jgi:signal transduction histidine kinase